MNKFIIRNRWETGAVILIGAKLEFCINEKDKPSKVHFGEVIAIDDTTKSFTFKDSRGKLFENITAIRNVGRIENWK